MDYKQYNPIIYCASWSLDLIVLLSGFLGRTVALPTLPSASTSATVSMVTGFTYRELLLYQFIAAPGVHKITPVDANKLPVMADIRRIALKPFLRLAFQ